MEETGTVPGRTKTPCNQRKHPENTVTAAVSDCHPDCRPIDRQAGPDIPDGRDIPDRARAAVPGEGGAGRKADPHRASRPLDPRHQRAIVGTDHGQAGVRVTSSGGFIRSRRH